MSRFSIIRLFFPLILVISIPLTIYLVFQSTDNRQRASEGTILHLVSDKQSAIPDQTMIYEVAIDSQTVPVKSTQINLSYPANKVDIVSIETSGSKFDIPLEEIKGNGLIRLGREASTPVFGVQRIATLTFKAKDAVTETEVAPVSGTEVISLDNANTYMNALSRTPHVSQDISSDQSFLATVINAVRGIFQ